LWQPFGCQRPGERSQSVVALKMGIKARERRVEDFFDGLFIRCIALERAIYGDLFPVVPNIENRNNFTALN
jgi:hypothetical protein